MRIYFDLAIGLEQSSFFPCSETRTASEIDYAASGLF